MNEPRKNTTPAVEELLEAIRLTQEYAQFPCLPGWSWWDAYIKYRPNDAARLYHEWRMSEQPVPHRESPVIRAEWGEHISQTEDRARNLGATYYIHNDRVFSVDRDDQLRDREVADLILSLAGVDSN